MNGVGEKGSGMVPRTLVKFIAVATEIARKECKIDGITRRSHPNQITPIYPPQHHCIFTLHDHTDIYVERRAWPLAVNRFDLHSRETYYLI